MGLRHLIQVPFLSITATAAVVPSERLFCFACASQSVSTRLLEAHQSIYANYEKYSAYLIASRKADDTSVLSFFSYNQVKKFGK